MLVAVDSETLLISHACGAPPIVCLSWATESGAGLVSRPEAASWLRARLASEDHVTTANGAYDVLCVLHEFPELRPLVLAAYEAGRVHDVQLRAQLLDIRAGSFRTEEYEDESGETRVRTVGYSLADLAQRACGLALDKGADSWRLRYNELLGTPLGAWPHEAREYALDDARATLAVHIEQERGPSASAYLAKVEPDQVRAALALAAIGRRGLCVDLGSVDALETELLTKRAQSRAALESAGIYRANGSRDNKRVQALCEAAYLATGRAVPRSPKSQLPRLDAATLRESGDPTLGTLAESAKTEKLLTSFVPGLRAGANAPLVCEYVPLVETGRTACRGARVGSRKGPQLQNLPRAPGVRECFVPRPGYHFVSVDYNQLELCSLAQICLDECGSSELAQALRAGIDLHVDLGCQIYGWDYATALARKKEAPYYEGRQLGKIGNFALPGGLGPEKLVAFAAATYGVSLGDSPREAVQKATRLRDAWRKRWVECYQLQRQVSAALDPVTERCTVRIERTGYERGNCRYTEACNTPFQGLAATGAKRALWRVFVEGPAHGIRPVAFIHDEVLAEVPCESAHDSAHALAKLMVEAMQETIPDVPISAEPALMTRWFKDAAPKFEAGRLVPWS